MRRPGPLHAAVSVFTVVPVPPVELDRAAARRAILALPWLGLLIGAVAGVAAWGVLALGGGAPLAAVLALAVIALLTGGLHLDGLADTADGLGSRRPAEEALALMRRSDVGPMGVAAVVLVLLVDAAALASPRLGGAALPLVLAAMPMVGRVSALLGTLAAPARTGGFGALFVRVAPPGAVALDCVAVAAVSAALGTLASGGFDAFGGFGASGGIVFATAALAAWAAGWAWQRHLAGRLGGLTGDTFGSLIEVSQAAFVLVAALAL